jgi:hypothetical protein
MASFERLGGSGERPSPSSPAGGDLGAGRTRLMRADGLTDGRTDRRCGPCGAIADVVRPAARGRCGLQGGGDRFLAGHLDTREP